MDCPDADTLNTFVAGKLDAARRATLVDHAATCADCHGVLDALLEGASSHEPTKVDRYVIERRIGAGAMGVVFAARDPELERSVAIKLLRGGGSAARLRREAQLLARLEHPNVVAVYDVGEHDGDTFVAMALVDGANLRTWLATPRDRDEVLRVLCDAGRGVAAAHAAGLIHRDLKPDNIFVATDGAVRVGDFGLARLDGDVDSPSGESAALTLTRSGMVPGSRSGCDATTPTIAARTRRTLSTTSSSRRPRASWSPATSATGWRCARTPAWRRAATTTRGSPASSAHTARCTRSPKTARRRMPIACAPRRWRCLGSASASTRSRAREATNSGSPASTSAT